MRKLAWRSKTTADGTYCVEGIVIDDGVEGEPCHVYWGTHGCDLPRGHKEPHVCDCGFGPPYYGPDTRFYGEDAERLGLPQCDSGQANLERLWRDVRRDT